MADDKPIIKATTKKNNNSYDYYYCNDCKITYKENEIEKIISGPRR